MDEIKELSLATNIVTGAPEVRCFIDEMQEFYQVGMSYTFTVLLYIELVFFYNNKI